MMSFFASLLTFFMVGCSKPTNPITWTECAPEIGSHPCDFTLNDQHGKPFNLYEHYGKPILIDFSAEWCYWCQVASGDIHKFKDEFNFIYVTILLEDRNGRPGGQGLARRWAEAYGDDEPILTGYNSSSNWAINGLPSFYMIDDEMKIVSRLEGWSLIGVSQMIMETQN
jgi:thiol-disulfide isomerase/thioredoxin